MLQKKSSFNAQQAIDGSPIWSAGAGATSPTAPNLPSSCTLVAESEGPTSPYHSWRSPPGRDGRAMVAQDEPQPAYSMFFV
jgi:hypothetical protein